MRNHANALRLGAFLSWAVFGIQSAALSAQLWVSCKPVEAAAYPERIHIKCASPVDDRFWYFAAPTTDARFAARALSVIEAAQLGDKFVNVLFDPNDQSGGGFGCVIGDCRPFAAVVMVESSIPPPSTCAFDTNRPSCPGWCAVHDDNSCPGYCTRHPTETGCPQYCSAHRNDPDCPGYCHTHPQDLANCEGGVAKECKKKPYLPQCQP